MEMESGIEIGLDIPIPAWAVIQGSLKYKITPQIFNMQRICKKRTTDWIKQFQSINM